MAGFVYRSPTPPNTRGTAGWFETMTMNDAAIPPGFLFCHSDGAFDMPQKEQMAGISSGGWPAYGQSGAYPNGRIGNS